MMHNINTQETQETKTIDEYRDEFEARLQEIDTEIAKWRQEWAEAGDEIRTINFEDILDDLKDQRATVVKKLNELNRAASENEDNIWDELKRNLDSAWNDFKKAIDDVTSGFRQS